MGVGSGKVNYNDADDLSYTIGVVKSPYIEHIMQKFAELFTRIGVEDPEPDAVQKILRGFSDE